MIEPDRRTSARIRAQLEAARTAGGWMPWAGAAVAVLLWGGVGVWLVATLGVDGLTKLSPLMLAGGAAAVFAPGLAMILAGVMAREGARSSQANAVVLTSARLLLEPAEASREEISTLGEAITLETQALNRALAETRQRIDGLKHDIETSVTAALKAAEIVRADSEVLVSRMGSEREGLTQLAENLRGQADSLAKAIPRHAQIMAEATRSAQEQVRQADTTLDQRLRDMAETSGHLAQRISQLDTMGAESRKRAQNLASVLMRLDEQLVQSTRMVEAATKAGELASAATKSTAESLRDTVSDALASALKATETINSRSAQASEDARQSMALLKEAGTHAEATTRTAAHAARAHADETEKRINQLADTLFKTATRATNAAESGLERARTRIEKASLLLDRMKGEAETSSVDDLILEPAPAPQPVAPQRQPAPQPISLSQPAYADQPFPLFGSRQTPPGPAPMPPQPVQAAPVSQPTPVQPQQHSHIASRDDFMFGAAKPADAFSDELILSKPMAARRAPEHDPFFDDDEPPSASWRGLLSGIDDVAPHMHDQSAAIVDRLDRAGVRLHAVKASDLRRIANAAHQGERQRRRAIRDTAPSEIQRVTRLLESDHDLAYAARTFVASEEPDALRVLSMADRSREDAAPRLSAYLLLDAALGTQI
ncbi:MAG: hypothetical protein ABMA14_02415 [Hyphomonadaceae bacterium]